MKFNLAKAALDGIKIRIEKGEDLTPMSNTITAAHEALIHHVRMKRPNSQGSLRLYFQIDGHKAFAGSDPDMESITDRYSSALSLDPTGLLSKVPAVVLDSEYHMVSRLD